MFVIYGEWFWHLIESFHVFFLRAVFYDKIFDENIFCKSISFPKDFTVFKHEKEDMYLDISEKHKISDLEKKRAVFTPSEFQQTQKI